MLNLLTNFQRQTHKIWLKYIKSFSEYKMWKGNTFTLCAILFKEKNIKLSCLSITSRTCRGTCGKAALRASHSGLRQQSSHGMLQGLQSWSGRHDADITLHRARNWAYWRKSNAHDVNRGVSSFESKPSHWASRLNFSLFSSIAYSDVV
jgi:hypothetical protein